MTTFSYMYSKTVWAIVVAAMFVQPAIARSLVVCDGPGGSVELDRVIDSSGTAALRMVIRNAQLIQNFVSSGFISATDVGVQGELVVPMQTMNGGQISNRYFGLDADGMGGYILTVRYVLPDGRSLDRVLVNYHFVTGCKTVFDQSQAMQLNASERM